MNSISVFILVGLLTSCVTASTHSSRSLGRGYLEGKIVNAVIHRDCPISCSIPSTTPALRLSPTKERAHHLPSSAGPRLVLYHQTFHDADGSYHSLLPLLTNHTGITHVIIAAMHLNEGPGNITLNDKYPFHDDFDRLWMEVRVLQACEVKVLGMLGGAAKGSYKRLGGNDANFEAHYVPLRDMLLTAKFDGVDIDVEEDISLETVTRLIARLRMDFGPDYLITLAPVASALIPNPFVQDALYPLNSNPQCNTVPSLADPTLPHLSGFSYPDLERSEHGRAIAWYNTQFYGGWGSARSTSWYDKIIEAGWNPERIVMGTVTNPQSGSDYVPVDTLINVTATLREKYKGFGGGFGGVMGWEYIDSMISGEELEGICPIKSSRIKHTQTDWVARLGSTLRAQELY